VCADTAGAWGCSPGHWHTEAARRWVRI
jgi:hypothetical protein